jgi:hypothetical protein
MTGPTPAIYFPLNSMTSDKLLLDTSGNNRHGTGNGELLVCEDGKFGHCLQFNTTGHVDMPFFDFSGPELSVAFWFRQVEPTNHRLAPKFGLLARALDNDKTRDMYFGVLGLVSGQQPYAPNESLYHMIEDGRYSKTLRKDMISAGSRARLLDGQWHHIAFSFKQNDAHGLVSYLDGQLVESAATNDMLPIPQIAQPRDNDSMDKMIHIFTLGFNGGGDPQRAAFQMAHFGFYQVPLALADVQSLIATSTGTPLPAPQRGPQKSATQDAPPPPPAPVGKLSGVTGAKQTLQQQVQLAAAELRKKAIDQQHTILADANQRAEQRKQQAHKKLTAAAHSSNFQQLYFISGGQLKQLSPNGAIADVQDQLTIPVDKVLHIATAPQKAALTFTLPSGWGEGFVITAWVKAANLRLFADLSSVKAPASFNRSLSYPAPPRDQPLPPQPGPTPAIRVNIQANDPEHWMYVIVYLRFDQPVGYLEVHEANGRHFDRQGFPLFPNDIFTPTSGRYDIEDFRFWQDKMEEVGPFAIYDALSSYNKFRQTYLNFTGPQELFGNKMAKFIENINPEQTQALFDEQQQIFKEYKNFFSPPIQLQFIVDAGQIAMVNFWELPEKWIELDDSPYNHLPAADRVPVAGTPGAVAAFRLDEQQHWNNTCKSLLTCTVDTNVQAKQLYDADDFTFADLALYFGAAQGKPLRIFTCSATHEFQIGVTDVTGSDFKVLYPASGTTLQQPITSVAVNQQQAALYWIAGTGAIWRATFHDADHIGDITLDLPKDPLCTIAGVAREGLWQLAVHQKSGQIYWTDDYQIWCANADGKAPRVVVSNAVTPFPIDLVIDEGDDKRPAKLYWIDRELHMLRRANLDGSACEDLYPIEYPNRGLALDPLLGKIYWCSNHHQLHGNEPGLIGYWKFDQQTGQYAPDLTGHGQTAVLRDVHSFLADAPPPVVDSDGWVAQFDGRKGFIQIGEFHHHLDHGITIEAWLRAGAVQDGNTVRLARDAALIDLNAVDANNVITNTLRLSNQGQTGKLLLELVDGTKTATLVTANEVLTLNTWSHVAVTIEQSGLGTIYFNGAVVASGPLFQVQDVVRTQNYIGRSSKLPAPPALHQPVALANQQQAPAPAPTPPPAPQTPLPELFCGDIAEVRIWSYARSADQLRANMKKYLTTFIMRGDMTGWGDVERLFEIPTEAGLALVSKTITALVDRARAQAQRQAAQQQAADIQRRAQQQAQEKHADALDKTRAAQATAQNKLSIAQNDAAQQRSQARANRDAAKQAARTRIDQANATAAQKEQQGQQQAKQIRDNASAQSQQKIAAAQANLNNAQKERSKY